MSKEAEIFVRIDQSLLDALKVEAAKCGTTVSTIVRMILIGERKPIVYEPITDVARREIERRANARTARRKG